MDFSFIIAMKTIFTFLFCSSCLGNWRALLSVYKLASIQDSAIQNFRNLVCLIAPSTINLFNWFIDLAVDSGAVSSFMLRMLPQHRVEHGCENFRVEIFRPHRTAYRTLRIMYNRKSAK